MTSDHKCCDTHTHSLTHKHTETFSHQLAFSEAIVDYPPIWLQPFSPLRD